ncbi:unnamed protein product [Chondrus crispus]|uniref:Uncharacterized protein n=1 Tax=Chondrus crispus TaxID=2769 RepID=R7QLG3_CHOCR|nr:unnamed protein product [Chondrus crispus]CDF38924.1 unnamed protein product [Chondrus crispus]|eukprot:XP_005718829.1 unnamed protein product [Chondrus crispus]
MFLNEGMMFVKLRQILISLEPGGAGQFIAESLSHKLASVHISIPFRDSFLCSDGCPKAQSYRLCLKPKSILKRFIHTDCTNVRAEMLLRTSVQVAEWQVYVRSRAMRVQSLGCAR